MDCLGCVLGEGGAIDSSSAAVNESRLSSQAWWRPQAHAAAPNLFRHRLRVAHRLTMEGSTARVWQRQCSTFALSEVAAGGFFLRLWQAGLAEYDEMEAIAWNWQSIDGAMHKAPLATECVGPNPTDRGKKWAQTKPVGRRDWRPALARRQRRKYA